MADKVITIKVTYDDAYEVPSNDWLNSSVRCAVGEGLLSCDGVIEEWDVEVQDGQGQGIAFSTIDPKEGV